MAALRIVISLALLFGGIGLTIAVVFYGFRPFTMDMLSTAAVYFAEKIVPMGIGVVASMCLAIWFFSRTQPKKKKHIPVAVKGIEDLELEDLRALYKSLYQYKGSYPAWKALQEYRQLILSLNPGNDDCLYHFHCVDSYLNKVVDEINKLRKYNENYRGHHWDEDTLPQAKGDHLLGQIAEHHPKFIDYENKGGN